MASAEDPAVTAAHLIDDDGQLLSETEIRRFFLSALCGDRALRAVGVRYHVVAVFGSQSSGKSTLLNKLFDTRFQTMDETQRRGQTTRGAFVARMPISLCAAADAPPLFVLDFEGTDGIERGEDQSFERQLSLFALSVADTLIINMWAVDVGRFNAANMSLLRTIFEVNLQLFAHESYAREEKPTLLVVLRDFTEADASHHIQTIRESFEKIWAALVKPEAFRESDIDALFELRYRCLPHYTLQRAAFDASVADFRSWFISPTSAHYLFADRAAMFRGVPLDGLASYLSSCWRVICQSKDLDIPTQREMLARHRCRELRVAAAERFAEMSRDFFSRLESGELTPRLSAALEKIIDEEIGEYNAQTQLYAPHVVAAFAAELHAELLSAEMQLLEQFAKTIATSVVAALDASIGGAVDNALRWLVQNAPNIALLPERATSEENARVFSPEKEKCRAIVREFWARVSRALAAVTETFESPRAQNKLLGRYAAVFADDVESEKEKEKENERENEKGGDAKMRREVRAAIVRAVHRKVRHRFAAMAENAADAAHQTYEQALTHTKNGTVRFFATASGLQKAEPSARLAGLELLGCLLYFRLQLTDDDENDNEGKEEEEEEKDNEKAKEKDERQKDHKSAADERSFVRAVPKFSVRENSAERHFFLDFSSLVSAPRYPSNISVAGARGETFVDGERVLLSEPAVQRAFELFTQKSEFTMQLQLRHIESHQQSLPAWVFPVLLVLGWNELWYLLTSPLLLLVVLLVAFIFFQQRIKAQWQALEETGPPWLVFAMHKVEAYVENISRGFFPERIETQSAPAAERHRDPMNWSDLSAHNADNDSSQSALRPRKE